MINEELVQQLSDIELATSVKVASMERATKETDKKIAEIEHDLAVLSEHRVGIAAPFIIGIDDDKRRIDEIKAQIVDGWDGDKNTRVFDAGTLKFRTTKSLKIGDGGRLLEHIIENTSTATAVDKYLKGFLLTPTKAYVDVHQLGAGIASIEPNTTVKLG